MGEALKRRNRQAELRARVDLVQEWIVEGLAGPAMLERAHILWPVSDTTIYRYIREAHAEMARGVTPEERRAMRGRAEKHYLKLLQWAGQHLEVEQVRQTITEIPDRNGGPPQRRITISRQKILPPQAVRAALAAQQGLNQLYALGDLTPEQEDLRVEVNFPGLWSRGPGDEPPAEPPPEEEQDR